MKASEFKPTGVLPLTNWGGMEIMVVDDEKVYYRWFRGLIRVAPLYWAIDEDTGAYEPMFEADEKEWKLNEFMLIGGLR